MNPQAPLTPAEAAKLLRVSQDKLYKWRKDGDGPAYSRLGHRTVRYTQASITAFLKKTRHQGGAQ